MTYPVSLNGRRAYAEYIRANAAAPWWDAVVLTASSERQAERYMEEIRSRQHQGTIPRHSTWPSRMQAIGASVGRSNSERAPRARRRSYPRIGGICAHWIIHSGGDSRRLPQYSLSGELFGTLPVKTPWGSTVFDEFMALSSTWVRCLPPGWWSHRATWC